MIYAFTGKKQSGKSTASTYLESKISATRINFKDALLEEIEMNFPDLLQAMIDMMDKTQYDGWGWTVDDLFREKPPIMRALLQNYGTEVRRGDEEDYWVERWKESVAEVEGDIIVDDVRFLNEAQAVKDLGGMVIKIERTDLIQTDSHSSETEMDLIIPDYTISVKTGQHDLLYRNLDFILGDGSTPVHIRKIYE